MKKLLFFSLLFAVGSVLFIGCEKEDETIQIPEDIKTISDISNAFDQAVVDFQTMGNQATNKNLKAALIQDGTVLPSNKSISILNDTTIITIRFGSVGTLCGDGRLRKGTITINATDKPSVWKIGSKLTYTTDNFEVDGYKIDITKVVTFLGTGVSNNYPFGYLDYSVEIDNGQIITPNGNTATITIKHNRKLLAGEAANSYVGWSISGASTIEVTPGYDSKNLFSSFTDNISINKDITKPLWYKHLVSGEVSHSLSNGKQITIDYGSGSVYDITTWRGRQTIISNGVTNELPQN